MPDLSSDASLTHHILAALPSAGGYFDPIKIGLYFGCILLWAHTCAWVQKDTKKVRVPSGMWVGLNAGSGLLSLLLFMFLPSFWISLVAYLLLFGSCALVYVFFRNKRVAPAETVLTLAHIQRLGKGKAGGASDEAQHGKDRTKIKDSNNKSPAWPTDPDQHAGYQVMQDLLFDVIWARASDVRMDLLQGQPLKIVYKVDGIDRSREPIDAQPAAIVFYYLKKIAGMSPEEGRKPQNGRFKASIGAGKAEKTVEFDVRASGSTAGQRILMKLVFDENKLRLPDVGFIKPQMPIIEAVLAEPKGLVLCTGPRASGVTTTLYAFVRGHDAFIQNIHTLEVTKLMDIENVTQHVFDSSDATASFGKRLRSILRTEPDVFLSGDLPDAESAAVAAAAAKQGKKIYAGMQAKDTFDALRTYLQLVNDTPLAAAGLHAIINQRLLRLVCGNCRRGYKPDPALLKKANLPLDENRPFYRPPNPNEVETDKHGTPILCPVCQGAGYLGRTGVFEVFVISDALRSLIAKGEAIATIKTEARKKGMLYLQEVALHKVYDGVTSINEVLRVTQEKPAAPARAAAS
jgi:type II secretory ATPase GspE/PulE/Tfp pilus assembly ATPase PilB-like protein